MADYSQQTCHNRWMRKEHESGLVSVIIPTYNRADFITETLNSVCMQTYRPMEIIVVDDGSTDNTQEIVGRSAKNCSRAGRLNIRYLHQEHKGAPAARNLGLIESFGEFIQFSDSDDLLARSKIGRQVELLSKCDCRTAVYGPWRFFSECSNGIKVYEANEKIDESNALRSWIAGNWFEPSHGLLWRRADVMQLGPWDENLAADQDGDFTMRFLLRGGKFVFCPLAWAYYCLHKQADSSIGASNSQKAFQSRYCVVTRFENELTRIGLLDGYRDVLSLRYAALAKRYACCDRSLADRCLQDSRRLSPDGRLPDIFSYPLLSKLLGLTLKQKIGHAIRSTFRIPIRKKYALQREPVATIPDIAELLTFDNSE